MSDIFRLVSSSGSIYIGNFRISIEEFEHFFPEHPFNDAQRIDYNVDTESSRFIKYISKSGIHTIPSNVQEYIEDILQNSQSLITQIEAFRNPPPTQQEINELRYNAIEEVRKNYENSFYVELQFTWEGVLYKIPLRSLNTNIDQHEHALLRIRNIYTTLVNKDVLISEYNYTNEKIFTIPLLGYHPGVWYLRLKESEYNNIISFLENILDNIKPLYSDDLSLLTVINGNERYKTNQLSKLEELITINDYEVLKNYDTSPNMNPTAVISIPSEYIESVSLNTYL